MKIILEIRPGEGGTDARLLVKEQASLYIRYAENNQLNIGIIEEHHLGSALG